MGTRIHKFFLNSGGFSLTEVLIGGAILAGVSLGSATLFRNQKKAQRSVEYDQKLAVYHSQLSRTMGTASNCNATIKSIYATPPTSIPAGNITTLFHCVPSVSNKCVDDNTSPDQSFDAYTASAFNGTALIATNEYIDNTNTWKINQMQIMNSVTATGPLRIRITYGLNPAISAKTINKDINLMVRMGPTSATDPTVHFKECLNSSESNVNNLQNDLCKTLNLSENAVASDGRIAVWDSATQTCKLLGSSTTPMKTCTSQGLHVVGIGADGVVRCGSMTTPTDAARLEDSTVQSCTGALRPVVQYVSGRFRIVCQ